MWKKPKIDRATAERRLTNRWREQCDNFPMFREQIPLELYVRRNLPHVMSGAAPLEKYDRGR